MKSFFWALLICLLNTIAAVITARVGLKKDSKKFSSIIFGSLVIRYFLVSAAVLFVLLYINIDKLVFGLTFLIATFILIISEILYLNNRANFLKTHNKTKQD